MATVEVADISSYQADTVSFLQSLAQYAQSVIVKITEGSESGDAYVNPKAQAQVTNGLTVFKSVGAYHYFKANSEKYGDTDPVNEAKWFIKNLVSVGLDKTTVCALDVEDSSLMSSVTHDINLFLEYMGEQGYKNLVVYASASWFTSGRIDQTQLYNSTPIWVASYGTTEPGVDNASAWQYTDNGHGLGVDFSYDFFGVLLGDQTDTTTTTTTTEDAMHTHAQEVYDYFTAKGFSDAAICGILGNLQHESNINPTQWQIGMPETWSMSSSTGYGIAQFTPAGKIKAYADSVGKDVSDINVQLDYIWSQITTVGGFYGGSKTIVEFAHETDPQTAAKDFLQGYEMHSASTDALSTREKYALAWWQLYNKGVTGTYGGSTHTLTTAQLAAAQTTADNYTIQASGTFTFNTACKVRNTPDMDADGVATYEAGQSVNYDEKLKVGDHFWLSYESSSGTRHYVPYANITTNTFFGSDTNDDDPIQDGSTTTTETSQFDIDAANATADGYSITVSGTFTFNTSSGVRNSTDISAATVATYTSGLSVNYDSKIKAGNYFWLSYESSTGVRRYVPYAEISIGTYMGTDTVVKDPIDDEDNQSSTQVMDVAAAKATPDNFSITVSGTFTFTAESEERATPDMDEVGLKTFQVGDTLTYDEKIKADDHFWLSYVDADGTRSYVPYANILKASYFGTDTNDTDPVQA